MPIRLANVERTPAMCMPLLVTVIIKGWSRQDLCTGESLLTVYIYTNQAGKSKTHFRVIVRLAQMSGKEQTALSQTKSKKTGITLTTTEIKDMMTLKGISWKTNN